MKQKLKDDYFTTNVAMQWLKMTIVGNKQDRKQTLRDVPQKQLYLHDKM